MGRPLEVPYQAVAAKIRQQILDGEWLPGEQIPSLDQLAAEHKVSRATIQKAIRLLVGENLLVTRPRWGTFVAER